MARKVFPAVPAKKKRSPRVARPRASPTHPGAHPRLIHGFLVRLAPGQGPPAGEPNLAGLPVKSVRTPVRHWFDTKREGPADDATFH